MCWSVTVVMMLHMPIDRKYGRVTLENQRNIGDDELVVVFRAKDVLLPDLLRWYRDACRAIGSPSNHLEALASLEREVQDWQSEHGFQVPRSENFTYAYLPKA